jgi:four helix bundle protein
MGMDLAEHCYVATQGFPQAEVYGLTAQLRRAAVSVPANIAEGYGREYRKEYMQFLRVAQGSLKELETHLILAGRIGYLPAAKLETLLADAESLGKSLRALIRSLSN